MIGQERRSPDIATSRASGHTTSSSPIMSATAGHDSGGPPDEPDRSGEHEGSSNGRGRGGRRRSKRARTEEVCCYLGCACGPSWAVRMRESAILGAGARVYDFPFAFVFCMWFCVHLFLTPHWHLSSAHTTCACTPIDTLHASIRVHMCDLITAHRFTSCACAQWGRTRTILRRRVGGNSC